MSEAGLAERVESQVQPPSAASYRAVFEAPYFWTTLTSLAGVAIGSIDAYIVASAMPSVLFDLGDPALYAWVTAGFQLATIVGLAIGGAWKDRSGLRMPFSACIALFALSSLACALAPNMALLVVFRAVQGLAGGGITAVSFSAGASYPERLRLRMFALNSIMWAASSLLAPLIGGIITDMAGWRWVFLVNLPLCLLIGALSLRGFGHAEPTARGRGLPIGRAALLAVTITALVGAPSAEGWLLGGMLIVGLIVGWLYLHAEQRAEVPVVPLSTWLGRGRLGSTLHATMFLTAGYFGVNVFLPLYLRELRGQSAAESAIILSVGGVTWTVGSIVGARLIRFGAARIVTAGALMIAFGLATIAVQIAIGTLSIILLDISWAIAAIGVGAGLIHLMNASINASPPNQQGVVSSAVQAVRVLGGAIGAALMGAIVRLIGHEGDQLRLSLVVIFTLGALFALWPIVVRRPDLRRGEG